MLEILVPLFACVLIVYCLNTVADVNKLGEEEEWTMKDIKLALAVFVIVVIALLAQPVNGALPQSTLDKPLPQCTLEEVVPQRPIEEVVPVKRACGCSPACDCGCQDGGLCTCGARKSESPPITCVQPTYYQVTRPVYQPIYRDAPEQPITGPSYQAPVSRYVAPAPMVYTPQPIYYPQRQPLLFSRRSSGRGGNC